MFKVDKFLDWILRRRRCLFCVAPFPVLKSVGFDAWRCPSCETDFILNKDGELDTIYHEEFEGQHPSNNHFPILSSSSSTYNNTGILCSQCSLNQQKIVNLLQNFEASGPARNAHQEYKIFSAKLEGRYPLCATCKYRVSVQLAKCEEDALQYQRKKILAPPDMNAGGFGSGSGVGVGVGGDWMNKLKVAQSMKWFHLKRKLFKVLFFWPEIVFQLSLIFKCIRKDREIYSSEAAENLFTIGNEIYFWFPQNPFSTKKSFFSSTFSSTFASCYFVIIFSLFFIQFNGIALNRRGSNPLIIQLFLLFSRLIIGNYLYCKDHLMIGHSITLVLASMGLAVIVRTGGDNSFAFRRNRNNNNNNYNKGSLQGACSQKIPLITDRDRRSGSAHSSQSTSYGVNSLNKNDFSGYRHNHHRYNSLSNQVPTQDGTKYIKPWPEAPQPGKLTISNSHLNYNLSGGCDENAFNAQNSRIRPTKLVAEDPFELEPMFSSFSLDDDRSGSNSRLRRSTVVLDSSSKAKANADSSVTNDKDKSIYASVKKTNNFASTNGNKVPTISLSNAQLKNILIISYNVLLTVGLLISRFLVSGQTSLVTVVLAASFGLRGFVWSRLELRYQFVSIVMAVLRLCWLTWELSANSHRSEELLVVKLAVDFVLISVR